MIFKFIKLNLFSGLKMILQLAELNIFLGIENFMDL